MGVDSKRAPPLPAPTETDTATPTELATDVSISQPGDEKSSYSLPEDGTPVTIRTRGHKTNHSQTSLLIEYFEGGKKGSRSGDRKPSVRVRLTPSKKSKGDRIQVTETKGTRKASLTRRIPLDEAIASREIDLSGDNAEDGHSMTSYASATEESNVSRNPIDIEIDRTRRRRRPASPLIPTRDTYQPGNPSEISAIPTDSFLDGSGPAADTRRPPSPSRFAPGLAAAATSALASAAMSEISTNKSRGKERGKERVKISDKTSSSKDKSTDKRRGSKSRTSSVSEHAADEARSPRRRSNRAHQESTVSAAESSVLSSNLSPSHRSLDSRSVRSGASKSSINNPKLLETVEDAIRRLILPELSALKREQSKREGRRASLTSTGTSASRDDVSVDRRRSSGAQRGEQSREASRHTENRNREARHEYDESSSLHSPSRDSLDVEFRTRDGHATTAKHGHNLPKAAMAAAAGAAGAAVAKGLSSAANDKPESSERGQRERRRRRTESTKNRSLERDRYADEYDEEDDLVIPAPPMPLMSDVNPSDMTRTSILSAETERHHSASEELVSGHDEYREQHSPVVTPTRARTPTGYQHTLGMTHANVSHGDLTALPRGKREFAEEYESDEFGRKVPVEEGSRYEHGHDVPGTDGYVDDDYEDRYYCHQDVPPPLKYVPYQAGVRGLSPIQSVSGYTEGGSEAPRPLSRDVYSPNALSSPGKSPSHGRHARSVRSQDSVPAGYHTRDYDHEPAEEGYVERAAAGQAVRGLGANPDFVHPPTGIESAVASLIDGSMLDQSARASGVDYDVGGARDSTLSFEEQQSKAHSSRDDSPGKMSVEVCREMAEERHATPGSRSQEQSQDYSEYEIDEYGRKMARAKCRHSPTASEAAITAGAVGAAAAALKAAQGRKQAAVEGGADEAWQPAGVSRNRSFKERTDMHGWEPRNTPSHSVDRLDFNDQPTLGASGLPDLTNPMPEVGYVADNLPTNPSALEEPVDDYYDEPDWSGRATPTQRDIGGYDQGVRGQVGGVGVGEAAAHMAATRNLDHDEWGRTSEERKRDTLITNPYEDASPIVSPDLNHDLLGARGIDAPFHTGSPGFGQKYDEGYISNGPNRTPDAEAIGKAAVYDGEGGLAGDDDPFYTTPGPVRRLSGMSQGVASPLYDSATGAGIERIENKDIVALMQHLMVRDAQRSARDTEIVALLMNAALEMRNSFREMKEFVQDTGDDVIFANVENTEKLQKCINGPRPYPGAASRSLQSTSLAGTIDDAAKKKNLWRRALQGLSAKGTSDLTRIEDMLMQLLGEVDVLKTQTARPMSAGQSYDNLQSGSQFEREGNLNAGQSGHLAGSQARGLVPPFAGERRVSSHRISTVEEKEEENGYKDRSPLAERTKTNLLAPSQADGGRRGSSVPPETPPQLGDVMEQQPLSAENTPRTEKGKKHKSGSSSGWLPKISRWSETTTSSVGRILRGSGKKHGNRYDDFQPPSRSGSSLASYEDHYRHDAYDDKLHTGFSDQNLTPQVQVQGQSRDEQSSLPGSCTTPDEAKYKAHRNSVNLHHPQPRPGQTERFRTALETSAQEYNGNPMTPRSTEWAGSATSLHRLPANGNRFGNTSSAAGAEGQDWNSSPAPPRPPKEPFESPGTQNTAKSSRMSKLNETSPGPQQSSESGYGTLTATHLSHHSGGSPKMDNRNLSAALGVPTRRPTGPRAMTPKSPEDEAVRDERRRKRDTFGTFASEEADTCR
ncbi:hypothetical protein RJ55_03576 [Drechmeria coniospora]|nr:hypothetical protein RJ55_03576 [Drechmeria coniospora]